MIREREKSDERERKRERERELIGLFGRLRDVCLSVGWERESNSFLFTQIKNNGKKEIKKI